MNPIILLLLLPVLSGMVLLLVTRSERRQRFVQQRLTKLTADDDSGPVSLSLVRKLHTAPIAIFQLTRKFGAMLNTAFEAAGNRIGLPRLALGNLCKSHRPVIVI
jgi:hypothetical protein